MLIGMSLTTPELADMKSYYQLIVSITKYEKLAKKIFLVYPKSIFFEFSI